MLICLLTIFAVAQPKKVCRGVAFQGGGSHGAYEVGVMNGLSSLISQQELEYDYVTGISVGAINAGAYAMFEKGYESQAAVFLKNAWLNMTGIGDVIKLWNYDPIDWLFRKPSLVDNSPLRNFMRNLIFTTIQRNIAVTATNLNTGDQNTFTGDIGVENLLEAIMCSSAIQVVFPHQQFEGQVYADGGIVIDFNIYTIVEYCREQGFQDQDIQLDVMLDTYVDKKEIEDDQKLKHIWDVLDRAKKIKDIDNQENWVVKGLNYYPFVDFRYIVYPSQSLGSSFDFSPETIRKLIALGESDIRNVVKKPITIQEIVSKSQQRQIVRAD